MAKRPAKIVTVDGLLPAGWVGLVDPAHPVLGLGLDVGTTVKKTSNPSVLSLAQKVGHEVRWPLVVRYKSKDPAVTQALIRAILAELRGVGLRARRLCIDATSERYFAIALRGALAGSLPVDLIVSSEKTRVGAEDLLWKAYLGNLLVNQIEDGYAALPTDEWVRTDLRSVSTNKGTFEAEILADGGHGDVFDSCKLSLHAVLGRGGPAEASAAGVGSLPGHKPARPGLQNPRARRGVPARRWR